MKYGLLFSSLLTLIGSIQCSVQHAANQDEPTNQTATVQSDLYVDTGKLWKSSTINVCWEYEPVSYPIEQEWVHDAIQKSWEKHSLVRFVGWGRCLVTSKGIRIHIADERPSVKHIGSALDGKGDGMILNFMFDKWNPSCKTRRESCIRRFAVHEFGHALSFAHEQNRPDTPRSCTFGPQGENGNLMIGPWDLNSVMNYCNPGSVGDEQISQNDIRGLQTMYGGGSLGVLGGWDLKGYHAMYEGNSVVAFANWNLSSNDTIIHTGDFDGNGRTDLLIRSNYGIAMMDIRTTSIYEFATEAFANYGATMFGGWYFAPGDSILNVGDFNGDKKTDFLIRSSWGLAAVTIGAGGTFTNYAAVRHGESMPGGWYFAPGDSILNVGDFNGDGRTDFLIRSTYGVAAVTATSGGGFMNYAVAKHGESMPGGWYFAPGDSILNVGDFNGDGRTDFLIRSTYGVAAITATSGGGFMNYAVAKHGESMPGGWYFAPADSILNVGDFNGDGHTDFLIRSSWGIGEIATSGSGFSVLKMQPIESVSGKWVLTPQDQILGVGDFDGDHTTDVLMRVSRKPFGAP